MAISHLLPEQLGFNMNRTAVIIQAHGGFEYLCKLAEINKDTYFIVHIDAKTSVSESSLSKFNQLDNLSLIDQSDRIKVYWGGSSQLNATLLLLERVLANKNIDFIHFISAECFPLYSFRDIEDIWVSSNGGNFIECRKRPDTDWRLKTQVIYSNTSITRTFFGRCLNRVHKIIGNITNPCGWSDNRLWYGSGWFSIRRELAEKITYENMENNYFRQFRRKPCADEHAMQVFIKDFNIQNIEYKNKRFIDFPNGKASPRYISSLNDDFINSLRSEGFWFVRKVEQVTSLENIEYIKGNRSS